MEDNRNQGSLYARYSRQILFSPIGIKGQEKLSHSRVSIVGMGALGSVLADHLVRAGVGFVRLIDRDFIEESNLQRQALYDEEDARLMLPKAIAAKRKLEKINHLVTIEAVVTDLHPENAEELLADVEVILDGTDNFQTRYLINEIAVKHKIPWVYGAAIRSRGMFATILPGKTPCYRCLFPIPPEGRGETCDTVGILAPLTHLIASYQAAEAIKILLGQEEAINPNLVEIDVWRNLHRHIDISHTRNPSCPTCGKGDYPFLSGEEGGEKYTTLCGRETVQILPPHGEGRDLQELAEKLSHSGEVNYNGYLLRFRTPSHDLIFFSDGRVLIHGTGDITTAKNLYARYVGS